MTEHVQVAVESPGLSAVWHDEYKNQPNGEATLQQKIDIQDGVIGLLPGSRSRFDCNPTFDPAITSGKREEAGDNFLPWPTWTFTLYPFGSDTPEWTCTLGGEGGAGNFSADGMVAIQSPENPDGPYQFSMGYAPIFDMPQPHGKSWLKIEVHDSAGHSAVKTLPWLVSA